MPLGSSINGCSLRPDGAYTWNVDQASVHVMHVTSHAGWQVALVEGAALDPTIIGLSPCGPYFSHSWNAPLEPG